jgi:hypothetical protein
LSSIRIQEGGLVGERMRDVLRQVDRAQAAAAIRRQRLLGAGIGRLDGFAVVEVVVAVHPVDEQDARLGVVVRRAHDLIPQVARPYLAVDPQAVLALVDVLARPGLRLVDELEAGVFLDGAHEFIGHAYRDVEVGEVALVLGVDEFLHVRVVAAQHAHLRASARAR